MRVSRWLQLRVLARAAKARIMRMRGVAYPPDERHPPGLHLQPADLAQARSLDAPLRLARANNRQQPVAEWQRETRQRLRELLSIECASMSWQSAWTRNLEGVVARRVYINRHAGVDIPVTVLEDPHREAPAPPLVIMLGTHSSVSVAMGEARLPYDIVRLRNGADIGLQAVREGYTAICIELASLGERRERRFKGGSGTGTAAEAALLFGHCLLGDRVSDLMATVDWWQAYCAHERRPHTHPWVLGHSAGGTVALFGAAIDLRLAGCIASGCVGFMRETLLTRRNEGGQNSVPGILNWMELDDVTALIAPRPLLAVSGVRDHIWPFAGCEAVIDAAKPAWRELRASHEPVCSAAPGEHRFHPEATWPPLRKMRTAALEGTD